MSNPHSLTGPTINRMRHISWCPSPCKVTRKGFYDANNAMQPSTCCYIQHKNWSNAFVMDCHPKRSLQPTTFAKPFARASDPTKCFSVSTTNNYTAAPIASRNIN
eukprot:scaffold43608_cov55-Attheya_sp.AAC.3